MPAPSGNWLWTLLRKGTRRDLDKIEVDLVKRPFEKRQFAGDPQQPDHYRVKTLNK